MEEPLLWAGAVACAGLAAAALLPLAPRRRLVALAIALLLAPVLVLGDAWGSERLVAVRDHPALLAAGVILAALALAALAAAIRRRPGLLVPALIAVLPFRIPVDLGGGSANLLVPLYALIAAGVAAALLDARAGAGVSSEPPGERAAGPGWSAGGPLRWVGPALGGFILLYALQAGYADDVTPAVQNVGFFLAPFAALFVLLERVEWGGALLRRIVIILAVEGLLFAAVAFFQYATGQLFWNDKVISGNEAHPYFRVNSLFFDPNILGRYLAVTLVALAALVAFGRRRAELLVASAVGVVLLLTLVGTFSQTSTIALIGGILVLAAARWGLAVGVGAGVATALAIAASLALFGGGGLSSESPGRGGLVSGGLEIGADAPIAGYGSGSFAAQYTERFGGGEGIAVVSHTEPITLFAEQGAVGLVAYAALLAATIGALLGACGLTLRGRCRGEPLAAALLAIYAVMVVHSLGYAAFLTDPITWAALGIAAGALGPAGARLPDSRRARQAATAAVPPSRVA